MANTNKKLREQLAAKEAEINALKEQVAELTKDELNNRVCEVLSNTAKRTIILLVEQRKFRDKCYEYSTSLFPNDEDKAMDFYESQIGLFNDKISSNLEDTLLDELSLGITL